MLCDHTLKIHKPYSYNIVTPGSIGLSWYISEDESVKYSIEREVRLMD